MTKKLKAAIFKKAEIDGAPDENGVVWVRKGEYQFVEYCDTMKQAFDKVNSMENPSDYTVGQIPEK